MSDGPLSNKFTHRRLKNLNTICPKPVVLDLPSPYGSCIHDKDGNIKEKIVEEYACKSRLLRILSLNSLVIAS